MYRCVPLHCPTAGTHAARKTDAAPGMLYRATSPSGLRSFPPPRLQDLLLQRQLGHQPTQTTVLLLQLLHPACLFQLQTTVFLTPAIIGLFGDARFPAGLPTGCGWLLRLRSVAGSRRSALHCVSSLHAPAPFVPFSNICPGTKFAGQVINLTERFIGTPQRTARKLLNQFRRFQTSITAIVYAWEYS